MSFSEVLGSKQFFVTVEVIPPKGNDLTFFMEEIERFKGRVDAIVVRELPGSVMRLGALSTGYRLKEKGVTPVVEFNCRDRNRLALQADLLNASVLGIEDILVTQGEDIKMGDHPEAKAVFDLTDSELLEAVEKMRQGSDLAGNSLQGSPSLKAGVSIVLDEANLPGVISEVERRVALGAGFVLTSPVFTATVLGKFVEAVERFKVPILASVMLLKSAGMANYINKHVPGISIPDEMVRRLLKSSDRGRTSIEIATELISGLKNLCQGVNIVPVGWESKVPALLNLIGM